jgi:hypothetical protein
MPAFSTHYIFANELMPFFKEQADFEINENALLIGAQGPDIFFFHRVSPWMTGKPLRKYGSLLHLAKPELLFENMREYCYISTNPDVAKSYVYGFFAHYALDRNCHPYVYFLQDEITNHHKLTNHHTAHNRIEFSIDSYLLNKRLKIEKPELFNTSNTINCDNDTATEIGKLLSYVVEKTINKEITVNQVKTAISDMKYIQKISRDPTGIKHIFITILETIIAPFSKNFKFTAMMRPKDLEKAKKYANIEKRNWKSPYSDLIRNDSFDELFELSLEDAKHMIMSFKQGEGCKDITENKSFLTGVETK